MKRNRALAYILLVPTLVLLLHAIFPHNHHFHNHSVKHCKNIHHEQERSSKNHCHAFNSTHVLIKNTTSENTASISTIFILNTLKKENNTLHKKNYIRIFINKLRFPKQFSFTKACLRAPPLNF